MKNDSNAKKPVKRGALVAGVLIMAATTALTLSIILKDHSLGGAAEALKAANLWWLAGGVAAALGAVCFQAAALGATLRRLCGRPVPFFKRVVFAMVGVYYSGITPSSTGGQPMQLYYMCRCGLDISHASLALLAADVAYQFSVISLPVLFMALRWTLVSENLYGFRWLLVLGLVIGTVWMTAVAFVMFSHTFARRACGGIVRLLGKLRILRNPDAALARAEKHLERYAAGADALRADPRLLLSAVGFTLLQLLSLFLVPFFVYKSLGLAAFSAVDLLALQSALYLSVCFLPLPGAAGATESGFATLFPVVFSSELVVPAMLLARLLSFYIPLLVSGAGCLGLQINLTRRETHIEKQ